MDTGRTVNAALGGRRRRLRPRHQGGRLSAGDRPAGRAGSPGRP